jgi:hypothetical protein
MTAGLAGGCLNILNFVQPPPVDQSSQSSCKPTHTTANYRTAEWQLSTKYIALIDKLNPGNRIINSPFSGFDYWAIQHPKKS